MSFLRPQTSEEWTRLWLRCLIVACLFFEGVELWSSGQHFYVRSETQHAPRTLGVICGVQLFVTSVFGFNSPRLLACVGIVVSIPAMLLVLLPTVAYN